ncbi:hypothetical protein [Helicobacter phage 1961P]|uniref:Uncharacterized protein n=1 Tax=Helicobacter phage 1961P TaxID=1154995 RepID=I6NZZ8_9CAUD|nr:hypothetical protein F419_gp01 [Helicobacter phage 1961P]AFC61900.1 hypothetical protein [Helicobacter phage 1961P]
MRQKKETATSFNKLKEITQAIQAQKNSVLKPTKRAFSERQRTTHAKEIKRGVTNA